MVTTSEKWLAKISQAVTGDPALIPSLIGKPVESYPDDCWLCHTLQSRVNGERIHPRYYLWELAYGGEPLGRHLSLAPKYPERCGKYCVNPKHQRYVFEARPGRSINAAANQERRSAVDVEWPPADAILRLMAIPPRSWPDDAKTDCWLWTGSVNRGDGALPMPMLGSKSAYRAVWELFNRRQLSHRFPLARCSLHPLCVNPYHAQEPRQIRRRPVHETETTAIPAPQPVESFALSTEDFVEAWTATARCVSSKEKILGEFTKFLIGCQPDLLDAVSVAALNDDWLWDALKSIEWPNLPKKR